MNPTPAALDHLVVVADTLERGAAWVNERLGVAPTGGGGKSAPRNQIIARQTLTANPSFDMFIFGLKEVEWYGPCCPLGCSFSIAFYRSLWLLIFLSTWWRNLSHLRVTE